MDITANRFRLEDSLIKKLSDANIRTTDVLLSLTYYDLPMLSLPEYQRLFSAVSRSIAPSPRTMLQVRRALPPPLPTPLPKLNKLLKGGIPCGMITEFVGPAGIGKSQFCFCLTASVLQRSLVSLSYTRTPTCPAVDPGGGKEGHTRTLIRPAVDPGGGQNGQGTLPPTSSGRSVEQGGGSVEQAGVGTVNRSRVLFF
eukprot:Rmarinus@m.24885